MGSSTDHIDELNLAYRLAAVRTMYGNLVSSALPPLAFSFLFLSIAFTDSPNLKEPIFRWQAIFIFSLICNGITILYWQKKTKAAESITLIYWERLYNLVAFMMGLSTGYFFWILDINSQEVAYVYIALFLCAAVGATLYTGLQNSSYLLYAGTVGLVLGLNFWSSDYFVEYLFGMAACVTTCLGFTIKSRAVLKESVILQFENKQLLEELKREKEVAEQASNAKTRFLAAASHDLRQPLQSLSLLLAALFYHLDTQKQIDILNKAKQSLDSLNGLLDSLLDISKLDVGLIQARNTRFDLGELIRLEVDKHRKAIESKGISISIDANPDLLITSDPVLVTRILSNLISNAARYTKQGFISVSARRVDDRAIIQVADSGIGIPEHEIDEIFKEFYQVDNPERDRNKGLGLGLSIVKRLCTIIGALIEVESQEGKGSRFTLTLQNISNAERIDNDPIQAHCPAPIEGLNVLVVDDEIAIRESMSLLLESWGCLPSVHASMDSALEYLSKSGAIPDAMVVDYRLEKNQTGYECIKAIEHHLKRQLPSLIVTGDTSPDRVRELEETGTPFIHKPIKIEELEGFLSRVKKP